MKHIPNWPQFDETEAEAVAAVVRSGNWWRGAYDSPEGNPTGETGAVQQFERAVADLHGAAYGLAVSSGTMALDIAVRALGIGPGDEVITTAYSYVATATCILQSGATPVFADLDPDTWNLDLDAVRRAITQKTRAIILVHFAGLPVDMDALLEIAKEHDLYVIEDAAHAFGAEWRGRKVGAIGHIGCFSFQGSKNLTTGEGGAIVTNDEALATRCRSLHMAGRVIGGAWYDHERLGWNGRMTEFQAAIGLVQLQRFPDQQQRREANARRLAAGLAEVPGISVQTEPGGDGVHGRHLFCFRYDKDQFGGLSHKRMYMALRAAGLPVLTGYGRPIYHNDVFAQFDAAEWAERCPNAEQLCTSGFWLHHAVLLAEPAEIDELIEAMKSVKARYHKEKPQRTV